jgi:hypothetical protein
LDRGSGRPPEEHLAPRHPVIDDAEDRTKLLPSAGTECVAACDVGDPVGPFLPPDRLRFVGLAEEKAVDPLDHHLVEGALNRERSRAGERGGVGGLRGRGSCEESVERDPWCQAPQPPAGPCRPQSVPSSHDRPLS